MANNPVILVVDDEPEVLEAVAFDLQRGYGERYRIVRAPSGKVALETLTELKRRGRPVALLLADQRMPEMTGIELLQAARQIFPEAKRVLLTAYSDTEVAIQAINRLRLDYYLVKPWHPPEEQLYPVLDELLADWQAAYRPEFEGLRVIGSRWSQQTLEIKEFLARNQVPYRWLDVESKAEAAAYLPDRQAADLPVVILPGGQLLANPDTKTLAAHIGLHTHADLPLYDLAIVGAGPAGLAAAVYAASEGLRTVLVERHSPGGQAASSARIENYLGFPSGLSGADLARRAVTQAKRFGVEILSPLSATGISLNDRYRILQLGSGEALNARAVLIATGVSYRTLDIPGCLRLTGAGVYYGAALTEAPLYRDQDIYIIGGANSAGQAAVHFARFARRVTMLVRGHGLSATMSQYLVDQINATPNITVRDSQRVIATQGETHLEALTIEDVNNGELETLPANALFIFIGANPHTSWLEDVLARDPDGYILSGSDLYTPQGFPPSWNLERRPYLLETSVPGIFVAGDVRHGSIKRVASAVGEGSVSVHLIHRYLEDQ